MYCREHTALCEWKDDLRRHVRPMNFKFFSIASFDRLLCHSRELNSYRQPNLRHILSVPCHRIHSDGVCWQLCVVVDKRVTYSPHGHRTEIIIYSQTVWLISKLHTQFYWHHWARPPSQCIFSQSQNYFILQFWVRCEIESRRVCVCVCNSFVCQHSRACINSSV